MALAPSQDEALINGIKLISRQHFVRNIFLVILLLFATAVLAQDAIPAGTVLPLRLNSPLNSKKSKAGRAITATIMQDVPLGAGSKIHAGTKVTGHVVEVVPASQAAGAKMSFRFDTIKLAKQNVPITTNLRALASLLEVHEAQIPAFGPDRGTPESAWTTVQVGGDVVYRGGGPVTHGSETVGTPVPNGVLAHLRANRNGNCRGETDQNNLPQALWVFSVDACGTYGLPDVNITQSGRGDPAGQITLSAAGRNFDIGAGSGLLLRVDRINH
jgi:hypothetical protein